VEIAHAHARVPDYNTCSGFRLFGNAMRSSAREIPKPGRARLPRVTPDSGADHQPMLFTAPDGQVLVISLKEPELRRHAIPHP
jgi:hypothetical protein